MQKRKKPTKAELLQEMKNRREYYWAMHKETRGTKYEAMWTTYWHALKELVDFAEGWD